MAAINSPVGLVAYLIYERIWTPRFGAVTTRAWAVHLMGVAVAVW